MVTWSRGTASWVAVNKALDEWPDRFLVNPRGSASTAAVRCVEDIGIPPLPLGGLDEEE